MVAACPSRAFVAAPFSPTSSWLSTDTTRICCWGMRLLTGVLIETVVFAAAVPPAPVLAARAAGEAVAAPVSPTRSGAWPATMGVGGGGRVPLGGVLTGTVVFAAAVPPAPVQVILWGVVAVGLPLCAPAVAVDAV